MSAFVVSDECINVILGIIKEYKTILMQKPIFDFENCDEDIVLNWLGNVLLHMNVDSVNARYDEHEIYEPRTFHPKKATGSVEGLIVGIKQIHCWQYQSCELDDYQDRWEWKLIRQILNCLHEILLFKKSIKPSTDYKENDMKVTSLKEYQDAPWGL